MTILDRYILRQFVVIFLINFVSLAGLYIVIDAFQHLDSFTAYATDGRSLLSVMSQFYAYQSFDLFDRTSGILAMVAAMFTVTWLQRHNEMTALMAAGISKFRCVRPIIVAAIALSVLAAANREFVIPQVRDELTRDTKDLGGTQLRDLEARFDAQTDILIGGESTLANERRILQPTFVLPASLAKYGKQLVAETAYYLDATAEHPAGYLLDRVTIPSKLKKLSSISVGDRPVIVMPRDAEWLKPKQVFVVSQLPFELLANGSNWRRYASIRELVKELHTPGAEAGADVRVAVHTRLMQPFMDSTMLMLGLPLMFSRRSRNVFVSIGICLVVGISFYLLGLTCHSLGSLSMLRPTLAAWFPLLVFVPIAVAMSDTFRT